MQDDTRPDPRSGHEQSHNRRVGEIGEQAAADHLERTGIRVVERNWRCPRGEIDIVGDDHGTIVFAEVKCRTSTRAGHPLEAITSDKRSRMRRLAGIWLEQHPDQTRRDIRLDVIAVLLASDGSTALEHIRGIL